MERPKLHSGASEGRREGLLLASGKEDTNAGGRDAAGGPPEPDSNSGRSPARPGSFRPHLCLKNVLKPRMTGSGIVVNWSSDQLMAGEGDFTLH
uniref:Uncharacterized protein n=1 Tax=Sphaerodactylus townsendi TaxID=933632 RepID=A0ACB8E8U2_9SAUR